MATEAQKKAMQKYQQSDKGKAARRRAQRRYERSRKGKKRAKAYAQTCRGQEAMAECVRRRELRHV